MSNQNLPKRKLGSNSRLAFAAQVIHQIDGDWENAYLR